MNKTFITLTGSKYYFGTEFLKPDMILKLMKEPDNRFDKEAIAVHLEGMGLIGYVANSINTVLGESISAGRLYDKIGNTAYAKVLYITPGGVICQVSPKSLPETKRAIEAGKNHHSVSRKKPSRKSKKGFFKRG